MAENASEGSPPVIDDETELNRPEDDDGNNNHEEDDEYHRQSDEPDAEGDIVESTAVAYQEPSYEIAEKQSFSRLVQQLELLYRLKIEKPKNPPDKFAKLQRLLPSKLIDRLNKKQNPPESMFPIMRLLLPDLDRRDYNMKEATIAKAYQYAFGWQNTHSGYKMLLNYSDPRIVPEDEGVGDFSVVLRNVLKRRIQDKKKGSEITVGKMNTLLDELAATSSVNKSSLHSGNNSNQSPATKKKKKIRPSERRGEWVKKLVAAGLTPLEHKWVVRILLQRLQISLGWSVILQWYHPLGPSFWSAHNSLKAVCNKLCQPENQKKSGAQSNDNDGATAAPLAPYFAAVQAVADVTFGNPFTPMMSEKTGFKLVLSHMSTAPRTFCSDVDNNAEVEGVDSLAVKFPAMAIETKLDGERFLIHFSRDGTVKMHSRRGNWYSELYSPVIGPAIRRALGHHGMDLILDGEILAWDNGRKETVPFGNNRTVAILRQRYMKHLGLLEEIDSDLHKGEKENKSMSSKNTFSDSGDLDQELAEECWLQFIAFDLLYVDGPGAGDFLKKHTSKFCHDHVRPGSIAHLEGMERKKLLYSLIHVQENEVEIVPTLVVRPNGKTASGREYFDTEKPLLEGGVPAFDLDSAAGAFKKTVPNLAQLDSERRGGLTDAQIAKVRAHAIERQYQQIVEGMRLEGLVFKVLSAPYVLGPTSRSLGYWRKFKPDYFNGSVASDLDVVVIGAYFATGLRLSGRPSSLLCACVDSYDNDYFYPMCKVNAGSMEGEVLQKFFSHTGFRAASEAHSMEYGHFFPMEDKGLPDFVTSRSKQKGYDGKGWKCKKEDYPDMWINPSDSCVLTLNAGEIVASDAFSPGITLRFPRVVKLRLGADSKEPEDIESELRLWDIYKKVIEDRTRGTDLTEVALDSSAWRPGDKEVVCRFLTEEELTTDKKKSKTANRKKLELRVETIKFTGDTLNTLDGMQFRVLEGTYGLKHDEVAVEEAAEEGWSEVANSVQSHDDVKRFIKKHGGRTLNVDKPGTGTFVIGGLETDPRVKKRIVTIENAIRAQSQRKPSASLTKTAIAEEKLSKEPGVLRWTYLFSAVSSFLNQKQSSSHDDRLQLQPCSLDYLARPYENDSDDEENDLEFGDLSTKSSLRRALGLVSKRKASDSPVSDDSTSSPNKRRIVSWRELATDFLDEEDAWVVATRQYQPFWGRYRDFVTEVPATSSQPQVILYPDLFDDFTAGSSWDDIGKKHKCNAMAAVLPLVRVMGGVTVPYLRHDVTHVLCQQLATDQAVILNDDVDASRFTAERELRLVDHIKSRVAKNELNPGILFVSPQWIRSQLPSAR